MVGFPKTLCLGLLLGALGACSRSPPAPPAVAKHETVAPAESFARLLEGYGNEHIAQADVIGAQQLADALAIERRYLTALTAVPRDTLSADQQPLYDLFRRQRELAIEGFTYPEELLPLKAFGNVPFRLAAAAVASGQRSLGAADYAAWLKELEACSAWLEQARANLRDGLARGYTTPRPLVERLLAPLEALGRDQPDNPFYLPLKVMADNVPAAERERLVRAYTDVVARRLLPNLRALHDFLAKDYLPKARSTLSLTDLPLGAAWYAHRLKRATGTDTPPAELHRQGLADVERLKARGLPAEAAPRSPADLLDAYQQLGEALAPKLPTLFDVAAAPPMLAVAALEFPLEPVSAASYQPARAGLPAALYVHAPATGGHFSAADFLAAALPGEYFRQLQQAQAGAAHVDRWARVPAYAEGWDMYAASLGEELGVYGDEPARAGWAARQLRCAAGLVVDTGVHTQGWTRDKALEYLRGQTLIDAADGAALLDQIVGSPGDATACELGFLKFQQLRARAQAALGARFDVREFHKQLLASGALPLDELDARIKAWWESSR